MRPALHAFLVNGRFGDPALYVELPFERRALIFDLGDLHVLSPRRLLRLEAALVTHAHMDHLIGFDTLLRHLVGREKRFALVGPDGIAARIGHKLQGYSWDLAGLYAAELIFEVIEVTASPHDGPDGGLLWRRTRFRLSTGFAAEPGETGRAEDGTVLRLPRLEIRAALLSHHGAPCLGYLLREVSHVNLWRERLDVMGLPTGPWLNGLKRAIQEGAPDDHPVPVPARGQESTLPGTLPLGLLRQAATVTPGQRIAYCTDLGDTPRNREAVARLAREADLLFLESAFAAGDAALAARRGHLTTRAAGEIARAARVRRLEPFHFSARYAGQEARMLAEAAEAFGRPLAPAEVPKG
ncbi:MBL fold metallo-hydrolase [Roseomonas gilardii subsp. gilardii]|uniref:MBL fold metallo-hydrolase n=1 Tax=Roseomonas gilardii TaxID=257708 RepID=UPI001FFA33B9|nr:MBL fold metallo-hydrolase [Roseomonas gilardii]UPG72775.1 MBL fold metallo-hydrolase [Roseomonas gilardii subsp. gilardii]